MTGQNITKVTILILLLIVIVYDIYAVMTWGGAGTISRVIWHLASDYPMVSFGAGFVMGHLFWAQKIKVGTGSITIVKPGAKIETRRARS